MEPGSPHTLAVFEGEVNGGFPEPPAGSTVRVVSARHRACGSDTRVRLPEALPARVVRRVVCQGCAHPFEAPVVAELGVVALELPVAEEASPLRLPALGRLPKLPPLPRLPGLTLPDPGSRTWRLVSVPVAATAVVGVLMLVQGGDDESAVPSPIPTHAAGKGKGDFHRHAAANAKASGKASFVNGSSYSLALPAGWERSTPEGGATFVASSPDGDADATLWVERDPDLDFATFEARSLEQLRQLAGSAHVVDRTLAPSADATVVRLAADAPAGGPQYEVTLRVAGAYRYYLATTIQADASRRAIDGVELIRGSFTPEAGNGGASR